jgi:hypothetical protein
MVNEFVVLLLLTGMIVCWRWVRTMRRDEILQSLLNVNDRIKKEDEGNLPSSSRSSCQKIALRCFDASRKLPSVVVMNDGVCLGWRVGHPTHSPECVLQIRARAVVFHTPEPPVFAEIPAEL